MSARGMRLDESSRRTKGKTRRGGQLYHLERSDFESREEGTSSFPVLILLLLLPLFLRVPGPRVLFRRVRFRIYGSTDAF